MLDRVINLLVYVLSGIPPRRPKRVVFGAWLSRRYADNPRYLFEYLCRTRPDLDVRWVGSSDELPEISEEFRGRFVPRGSLAALWTVLTAGRAYISHGYHDLAKYNLCRGAIVTYLGHGLTIKRMGASPQQERGLVGVMRRAVSWANSFDRFAVSSHEHAKKLLAEYSGNGIAPEKLVYIGQPRTDPLLATDREQRGREIRRELLERHGLPAEQRLVTYLPTFRDSGTPPFSFLQLDSTAAKTVDELLARHEAVLVEKVHFVDGIQRRAASPGTSRRIVGLGSARAVDTQDLLLATDVLITDYSGCYIEYLHLDRPVLHFAYDLDIYANADRGLYYSLEKVAGGPVAEDLEGLLRYLDECLQNPARESERRRALRDWFLECEDGRSCERFAADLRG